MDNAFNKEYEKVVIDSPLIETFSPHKPNSLNNPNNPNNPNIAKYMHKYYVKLFMQSLTKNIENNSLMSDDYGDMYDHIKKCKICKEMIRNKNSKKEPIIIEGFSILDNPEYKKMVIIILLGLFLIIIVDLFVRIGRKTI